MNSLSCPASLRFHLLVFTLVVFLTACSLPKNTSEFTYAPPPAKKGELALAVAAMQAKHPGLTGVLALTQGADAFATRLLLADNATATLDVQYYIWRNDLTGNLLLASLKRAANRGVKVRLLLDDYGVAGLDPELAALNAHPNISVRLWNPFQLRSFKNLAFTYDFFRLNRRMHNKSFTVDGVASVLGGRNIGDEYFSTGPNPLFADLDVLVLGGVTQAISEDFNRYWNSPSAYDAKLILAAKNNKASFNKKIASYNTSQQLAAYQQQLAQSEFINQLNNQSLSLEWTQAVLISDNPAKGKSKLAAENLFGQLLEEALGEITSQFDGVSPYFVPGNLGVANFAKLQQEGVQVRMLTNSLAATNVVPVHAGYARKRKQLLEAGVELYELKNLASQANQPSKRLGPLGSSGSSLHAKTFALDGKRLFVGSYNFDPRSERLNTEMGLLINSPSLANSLHASFDAGFGGTAWQVKLENNQLVWQEATAKAANQAEAAPPLTQEPGKSFWKGIKLKVISWLPVEWLL